MAYHLKTIRGMTDGVPYETLDLVLEQLKYLRRRERALGRRVEDEEWRMSFYEGEHLLDAVRIEDEQGNEVRIPVAVIDMPSEELADDARAFDRFGAAYEGPLDRDELYDRDADPKERR